jgi:multimeric flavodoxin WrbA
MGEAGRKQVLGVVGSPRRGGNTEVLVDEVLRGAEEAGATVEKVILSELDISPCRACDGCAKIGECVQQDDMPALLDKMRQSQVWVLGTPVYWWGPSAQLKAFLDRWYSQQVDSAHAAMFRGKRVILVVPMGDADPATARHTVGMFEDALNYVKAELFAAVLATSVNDRGEVRGHPDLLEAARRAGREAVGE